MGLANGEISMGLRVRRTSSFKVWTCQNVYIGFGVISLTLHKDETSIMLMHDAKYINYYIIG